VGATYDPQVAQALDDEPDLAVRAVSVERVGVENPRKDLRKWSDFRTAYGFFFPQLFEPVTDAADERFAGLGVDADVVRCVARRLRATAYRPIEDGDAWFGQIRELAAGTGSRRRRRSSEEPAGLSGSIREASQIVRITRRVAPQPEPARRGDDPRTDEVVRRLSARPLTARGRCTRAVRRCRRECAAAPRRPALAE
jgi:glutamyl-tRNA synthetase